MNKKEILFDIEKIIGRLTIILNKIVNKCGRF